MLCSLEREIIYLKQAKIYTLHCWITIVTFSILTSLLQIINNVKHSYQAALKQTNFNHELKYENKSKTNYVGKKKRNRTKKVIFFNPPYCQSFKTNIGKEFLHLIDKHLKSENMKKIFNRNNRKCCMENVKSLISRHSKNVLSRACNKKN